MATSWRATVAATTTIPPRRTNISARRPASVTTTPIPIRTASDRGQLGPGGKPEVRVWLSGCACQSDTYAEKNAAVT